MVKKGLRHLAMAAVLIAFSSCGDTDNLNALREGFRVVPDSVQTAVYWYWISDNISEEGVVKDLQAMKKVGINRAFLGSMGVDGVPYGNVKFLSPEWWKITHTALKTATDLGIEIGIFNSPGWSQSGGPWVKPEEAMRYLSFKELVVEGDGTVQTIELPGQDANAQLVKVQSFPALSGESFSRSFVKENGKPSSIDVQIPENITIRSLTLQFNSPVKTQASLLKKDGDTYQVVKEFEIDRSNAALNVGFMPYAPVVISLPETCASSYRLAMSEAGAGECEMTLSEIPVVERYPEKSLAKMFQTPLPMWHEYMWQSQPEYTDRKGMVDPENIIDLTDKVSGGTLKWEVPAGRWTILCSAMLPTGVTNSPAVPEATGLEIDKMSRKHIESHFNAYIGEILKRIPEADRKSFKIVVQDSYETGGLNWTDDMIDVFRDRYGYDPVPYIPTLSGVVVGSEDISDRFLWDLRRLIADRVAYDYVGGLRDVCHRHGLQTWLENYGHWGFPGEFLMYGGQSDQVSGEFWSEGSLGDIENRAASSCGHIYGKRQIWAESCTSGGPVFSRYPRVMKQRIDRFFTEGINSTLLHLYIQQPNDRTPGMAAWFGNEFNRNNTWFNYMDLFTEYLKRCNFMLQQGDYVADVAYFIGEDAPKMTGVCDPALPYGYSFDYINAEVLKKHSRVENGRLILDSGMEYRVLVLPKQETMRPEVLSCIAEMVEKGLTVLGPTPSRSPSLSDYPLADEKVKELSAKLWNGTKHRYGKGWVYADGVSLSEVFSDIGAQPDFSLKDNLKGDASVLFIHRRLPGGDIYFISNQEDAEKQINPSFLVENKIPELWNPVTGKISSLPYEVENGRISVCLDLQPFESAFIVFDADHSGKAEVNVEEKEEEVVPLDGEWTVSFGDDYAVRMDSLQDWSRSEDEKIKYYSGTAVYEKAVDLVDLKGRTVELDLGNVMVMAKVDVNGQYAGGVWTAPYRLDITRLLKEGKNEIRISVVNNWMNRLIGDAKLPPEERTTWTNINVWNADSPLQSSGLLGPVQLYFVKD